MLHLMLVYDQAASSLSPRVQACDTDVPPPAESPTLSAGTCCDEVQCEAEANHHSPPVNLCFLIHRIEHCHLSVRVLISSLRVEGSCPGSSP